MAIRLGDEAPDFIAETTEGPIQFHAWKAGQWAVLFSHPKDFTPVCTTELGSLAALQARSSSAGAEGDRLERRSGRVPPALGAATSRKSPGMRSISR